MEMEVIRQLIDAVNDFDQSLAAYEAEGSNENREAFAAKYKEVGSLINSAPVEIRGEIGEPWSQVDLHMQALRTGSNKLMKFASLGMSAGTSATSLRAIRGENGKILKILNNLAKGKDSSSAVASAPVELSDDDKAIVGNLYNELADFDKILAAYEAESSNENREAFAAKYKEIGELLNNAPVDIRGEVSEYWSEIDVHMQGLRTGSNKMMKFATFGMSAGTSGASLKAIRGLVAKMMKTLKGMLEGKASAPAGAPAAAVQLSDEEKGIVGNLYNELADFDKILSAYSSYVVPILSKVKAVFEIHSFVFSVMYTASKPVQLKKA